MRVRFDRFDQRQVASEIHEIWGHWMRHLFSQSTIGEDGRCEIPAELVRRWQRQLNTPFSELSEEEKQSDLDQADRFLAAIADKKSGEVPPED